MIELIFAGVVIAGFLVLADRKDKRSCEQTAALVAGMRERDEAHRAEVQTLLQRIQAPEVAVVQHQQHTVPDENPWPLSDVESAEAQNEVQRMVTELERMEAEGIV